VVELLAAELGWDGERQSREMADALERINKGI
jgi:hypothetical protein